MISLKAKGREKMVLQKPCNKEHYLASQMLTRTIDGRPSATSLSAFKVSDCLWLPPAIAPRTPHKVCNQIAA